MVYERISTKKKSSIMNLLTWAAYMAKRASQVEPDASKAFAGTSSTPPRPVVPQAQVSLAPQPPSYLQGSVFDPYYGWLPSNYATPQQRAQYHLPVGARDLKWYTNRYGDTILHSFTHTSPEELREVARKNLVASETTDRWGDTHTKFKSGGEGWNFGNNPNSPARKAFREQNNLMAEGLINTLSPQEFMKKVTFSPSGGIQVEGEGVFGADSPTAQILTKRLVQLQQQEAKRNGMPAGDGSLEHAVSQTYVNQMKGESPYAAKARALRKQQAARGLSPAALGENVNPSVNSTAVPQAKYLPQPKSPVAKKAVKKRIINGNAKNADASYRPNTSRSNPANLGKRNKTALV